MSREQVIVPDRSEQNCVDCENMTRQMRVCFDSYPENEQFARMVITAFLMDLNPTLDEMADIKTAVSEAVTNAIIHGYEGCVGQVSLACEKCGDEVTITVSDEGRGIADVEKAREPFYTTKPEAERSGMGFSFMEAFMDELHIKSAEGRGTCVEMKKKLHLPERT